jgi:chromosome segregation ATPase
VSNDGPTQEFDNDIVKLLASIKEDIAVSRKESQDGRASLVARLDHLDKCVDALEEELRKEKAFTHDTIKYEYERLGRKISSQDDEIRRLKRLDDQRDSTITHVSETSLEHDATLGLAIGHIGKLEERLGHVETKQDKSNEAVGAIVEELGIEGKVQLGKTLPPGVKTQTSSLSKISKENKGGLAATIAAIILLIVQIIMKFLEGHH